MKEGSLSFGLLFSAFNSVSFLCLRIAIVVVVVVNITIKSGLGCRTISYLFMYLYLFSHEDFLRPTLKKTKQPNRAPWLFISRRSATQHVSRHGGNGPRNLTAVSPMRYPLRQRSRQAHLFILIEHLNYIN